ncbi:MAG TPA: hypothetical protein VGX91_05105 [Candidatus Cybelea sp.]|jgi:hypothetical protein|nr:hypothetical protein [Candidatus Cybelea sp.]
MPCSATIPNLTAREQAHYLYEAIPPGLFRVQDENDRIPWRLSPEPFALSPAQLATIEQLGTDLLKFYRVLNGLYNRSARGTAPAFIAEYLDRGKPEQIVKLQRQNRFKQDVPGVIRPDLILTADGFAATELDSIPGGMGFLGAMTEAYCRLGLESAGGADGIPKGFAAMLRHVTGVEFPTVAIVVSDESADYRPEMSWLADALRRLNLADVWLRRPHEIAFTEEGLFIRHDDGREARLDAIYRNFELFDLFNVPKQELMLYAARHNRVRIVPAPKASLEEKLAFALLHHDALKPLWRGELGRDVFERLLALFPETWVVDPRPMPPQGAVAGLQAGGAPVFDFRQLAALPKSERAYVLKPSGFSELAWGSRGVKIADDLTREEWTEALDTALNSFDRTPYILQRFHKGKRVRQGYFDRERDEISMYDGRVRLCPYYFVTGEESVQLGGILATIAPADKKLIHGMTDAVMTSSIVREGADSAPG